MEWLGALITILASTTYVTSFHNKVFRPCNEISRELRFPCRCALGPVETVLGGNPAIYVDCDRIVFSPDLPNLPYGAPIVAFSQKWVGHQALPTQIFSSNTLPIRSIDLSGNLLRRLTETLLSGFRSTLIELRLADNLLGDTLNPIFSSNEFHGLTHLKHLDLSGNSIRAVEEGILEGCKSLQELRFDRNKLASVPGSSLNGPSSLRLLSLKSNRIADLKTQSIFQAQMDLEEIDLSDNVIAVIEGGAFNDLAKLRTLKITRNKLSTFNSDVFDGAVNLRNLDLSDNFIVKFPTVALTVLTQLKYLNLSANLIQTLDHFDLLPFKYLDNLDLSRNNIANIGPGTFLGLKKLTNLDISVNTLRTIEDDAFEGLDNLQNLNLKDNNILLIPASALGRLPKLTSLQLDYNRIAALSGDILRSIADQVTSLVISENIIRELPPASFQYFQKLRRLDLTRNLITLLNSNAFLGLESTLTHLFLGQNRISMLSGTPIALTRLQVLDLSENNLSELSRNTFESLPALKYLNLSYNHYIRNMPVDMLLRIPKLETVDMSYTSLRMLPTDLFGKSQSIRNVYLSHNALVEVGNGVFANLPNLTEIDLSYNAISNIRQGAFVNVMGIRKLNLKSNQLSSFKGEMFNTGTSLEDLNIADNQLSYLYPSSFRIHPRLKEIRAANNKFNFFPAELIATLQYLEFIDLSGNFLKTVDELDFARLPRLRKLFLSHNRLESVSEMAFHNSTQLQILDLSRNKLDRLGERTFEGLVRLELLNLEENEFSELPDTIFERTRLHMLENINLARNRFDVAPLEALQRQYFFISSVDLSHNHIKDIPADDSIMVNIKKLDLSFNPLTQKSINNVLGEPKTVRELNLAGTGISEIVQLETPFLNRLNLSFNNVTSFPDKAFERTTLLENIDLSNNQITKLMDLKINSLRNLQSLNVSLNPIQTISFYDFEGFEGLRVLSMHSLEHCTKIEKMAFKSVSNLAQFDAYNYPKLGYLDINGLLRKIPALERVNIETKDAAVGSDQFQSILHPRLKELGISGSRLRSLTSGTFSGLKGENVEIKLLNTSLISLPPALFFSVPRSSRITLDVSGSQLSTLSPQMLATLDDRRGDLKINGLETNPIVCDCNARALRRWLPLHMTTIRCSGPDYLMGKLLVEIGDDELSCDPRKITTVTTSSSAATSSKTTPFEVRTTEPEIIWSVPPTEKPKAKTIKPPTTGQSMLNNEDTLIIGIVGGVVAFIAILIIVICIIRLRMTSHQYKGGPLANGGQVMGPMVGAPGSSCACSVKGGVAPPPIYSLPPAYGPGCTSTLPHKMQGMTTGPPSLRPSNYSTMGRVPYYQNNQPYFIATYPSDEKIYR